MLSGKKGYATHCPTPVGVVVGVGVVDSSSACHAMSDRCLEGSAVGACCGGVANYTEWLLLVGQTRCHAECHKTKDTEDTLDSRLQLIQNSWMTHGFLNLDKILPHPLNEFYCVCLSPVGQQQLNPSV